MIWIGCSLVVVLMAGIAIGIGSLIDTADMTLSAKHARVAAGEGEEGMIEGAVLPHGNRVAKGAIDRES